VVEVGPVDVGLDDALALALALVLALALLLGLEVGPVEVVYVAAVYAALHCVPQDEGIENEYTRPPLTGLPDESMTWISYWLPPATVGAMM
jgi:hypothetical protein